MDSNKKFPKPVGGWFHSHEEDTPDIKIFRREGFDFPFSRGRMGFRLLSNGKAQTISTGPDDVPVENSAHWLTHGNEVVIRDGDFDGLLESARLIIDGPDKILLVRK
jgi:hypothetical protein